MQRRERERGTWVSGPHQHGARWRIVVGNGAGRGKDARQVFSYATQEEAEAKRRAVLRQIKEEQRAREALTWEMAIERFIDHFQESQKPRSIETVRGRLRRFFAPCLEEAVQLSREQAATLYKDLRARPTQKGQPISVQEHHHCLSRAKALAAWLVKQRLLRDNPLIDVEAVGRPKRGEESKPQLRIDEARQLIALALELGERGDAGAAATLCAVLCGMRATAIATRHVRDLDDRGRKLWTEGKTAAGRVRLSLIGGTPEEEAILSRFRAVLARQAIGKSPTDPLIGTGHDRWWIRRQVGRLCQLAKVPVVCAHALRGTHVSAAYEEGESPAMVARSVGHAGTAVGQRHYATQEAQAAGRQKRALTALQGEATGKSFDFPVASQGPSCTPEER